MAYIRALLSLIFGGDAVVLISGDIYPGAYIRGLISGAYSKGSYIWGSYILGNISWAIYPGAIFPGAYIQEAYIWGL